nr:ATP-dependent Clp protease ATP-binding subunit ClpC [Clostridiales bacterium]
MFNFSGFTQKANTAINLAVETAENLGHTYIGSEHLLLGLIKEGNGIASKVLADYGVSGDEIEDNIKQTVGVGTPTVLTPNDFTPRFKNILEISAVHAKALGHSYIGTEHLLMAILSEKSCWASDFIRAFDVAPEDMLEKLVYTSNLMSSDNNNNHYY